MQRRAEASALPLPERNRNLSTKALENIAGDWRLRAYTLPHASGRLSPAIFPSLTKGSSMPCRALGASVVSG